MQHQAPPKPRSETGSLGEMVRLIPEYRLTGSVFLKVPPFTPRLTHEPPTVRHMYNLTDGTQGKVSPNTFPCIDWKGCMINVASGVTSEQISTLAVFIQERYALGWNR